MAASPDAHVPEPMSHAVATGHNTTFWIGLALAVALHGAPFLWFGHSSSAPSMQQRMGERDGDPEAITVDVMDETAIAALAPPPPTPPPQPESAPSPPVPVLEPPKPPTPAEKAKPPPPEQQAVAAPETPGDLPPERPPQKKPTESAELMKELVELFAPDPVRNNQPRDTVPPTPPRDASEPNRVLETPMEFQFSSGGVGRPVDITRSGENDDYGRNVIRALKETIPDPHLLVGTVGIKFLLSETGQLLELQLVKSSGYPILDQSIVLAVNRSRFPVSARGSKVADRVFLVMYIYDSPRRR